LRESPFKQDKSTRTSIKSHYDKLKRKCIIICLHFVVKTKSQLYKEASYTSAAVSQLSLIQLLGGTFSLPPLSLSLSLSLSGRTVRSLPHFFKQRTSHHSKSVAAQELKRLGSFFIARNKKRLRFLSFISCVLHRSLRFTCVEKEQWFSYFLFSISGGGGNPLREVS